MTERLYRTTPFSCGSCFQPLDFELQHYPAQASYVHRDGHQFLCDGGNTDAHSAPLLAVSGGPRD